MDVFVFPVLFVLGALMGDGNPGVCRRIGWSWGVGQKALLCQRQLCICVYRERLSMPQEDQSLSDTGL